jgi:hypothetical protein
MLSNGNTNTVHAVVAVRWGGLFLRSHHDSEATATAALHRSVDAHPLLVMPATVELAANGNVRVWHSLADRTLAWPFVF